MIARWLDELLLRQLHAGVSRARVAAELLVAAAVTYDAEHMLQESVDSRRQAFVELAASAYDRAAEKLKGVQPL